MCFQPCVLLCFTEPAHYVSLLVCFLPVRQPPASAAVAAVAAAEEAADSAVMPAEWEMESKGCWE